jgi:alpha-tubulin suppressor-like RCC1 family protein
VCAVTRSGELYCWGENISGVLGKQLQDRTSYLDVVYPTPQQVQLPAN